MKQKSDVGFSSSNPSREEILMKVAEATRELASYTNRKLDSFEELAIMDQLWMKYCLLCKIAAEKGITAQDIAAYCPLNPTEEEKSNALKNVEYLLKNGMMSQKSN